MRDYVSKLPYDAQRSVCFELALDEICRDGSRLIADRRLERLAPASSAQRAFAHQACGSLVADAHAVVTELGLDSRPTVRASRLTMQCLDPITKVYIEKLSFGRLTPRPRIVAAFGDLQNAAHRGDGKSA
jgi:hypothetical protein